MAVFQNFPYTNLHNLNLDWIIKTLKAVEDKVDNFDLTPIKFADPIEWDITESYEQYTIVKVGNTAYISKQPVPAGVSINDADYWESIYSYSPAIIERHIVCIGDSYNDDTRDPVNSGDGWGTRLIADLALTGSQSIGIGGAGFATTINFLDALDQITVEKANVTDVIVMGGYNDRAYSAGAINTGIQTFVTACKAQMPNAEIHIGWIGRTLLSNQVALIKDIRYIYKDAAATAGVSYINNIENILRFISDSTSDNIHITANAEAKLTAALKQYLKTGYCPVTSRQTGVSVAASGIATAIGGSISAAVTDQTTSVLMFNFNATVNHTFNADDFEEIATFSEAPFNPRDNVFACFTQMIYANIGGGQWQLVPCQFVIKGGTDNKVHLCMRPTRLNSSGTGWDTSFSITNFYASKAYATAVFTTNNI